MSIRSARTSARLRNKSEAAALAGDRNMLQGRLLALNSVVKQVSGEVFEYQMAEDNLARADLLVIIRERLEQAAINVRIAAREFESYKKGKELEYRESKKQVDKL